MKQLEKLIIETQIIVEPGAEVERMVQVCNTYRYYEGPRAVFPTMTQRLELDKTDISCLVSLYHNYGACLHVCQYAPPHEFAINVPRAMMEVRLETCQRCAQPTAFGALYRRVGATVTLVLVFSLTPFLLLAIGLKGSLSHPPLAEDFYQVFPHNLLIWMFGSVFVLVISLLTVDVIRFRREISPGTPRSAEIAEASHNALTLKYLDGGHGKGYNEADDAFILMCCRLHHFTFYGFLLCFAAIMTATGYHYFADMKVPYPFFSVPIILSTLGGIGLIVSPAGLSWLNLRRSSLHGGAQQKPMDRGFILLLLPTNLISLALPAGRGTLWMAILLVIHLGVVMALSLTIPYGKFAHGFYRYATLFKWAIEKRRGEQTGVSGD